jgi:mannose-6-phosphate isomerase-like protein (cupin superfamily)
MVPHRARRFFGAGLFAIATAGCHGENTGTIAGPPLTIAPSTSTPDAPPTPGSAAGLAAAFHELSASGVDLPFASCQQVLVTPVIGGATAAGAKLATGDVLAVRGLPAPMSDPKLSGQGLALVASAPDPSCVTRTRVVRAAQAPELTFSGGAMHARLDIDDRDAASFYLGRLWGTAGVPEHAHEGSREVLCAVEASGTVTLNGVESRLGPRTCVSVEPGVKHSWKPDPGSNFAAVQMYSPAGPEQRFKKRAAEEAARDL